MDSSEIDLMAAMEESYWWYRALHRFVREILPEMKFDDSARLLDLGAGSGALARELSMQGYKVIAADISDTAIRHCRFKGVKSSVVSDANKLCFGSDAFDLVTCVDVLECAEVTPSLVIEQIEQVLRPGGYALFVVAAHMFLSGPHDRAVGAIRRFSRSDLSGLFDRRKFEIKRDGYLFGLLFPLLVTWKLVRKIAWSGNLHGATSDLTKLPAWLNKLLLLVCMLESRLLRHLSGPLGTSAFVLIRKLPPRDA